jgi:hypothetical protein
MNLPDFFFDINDNVVVVHEDPKLVLTLERLFDQLSDYESRIEDHSAFFRHTITGHVIQVQYLPDDKEISVIHSGFSHNQKKFYLDDYETPMEIVQNILDTLLITP